ncbi:MAG: T9SS type A sorting domain-containing protein, partial [Bacteroidota bacterium]
LMVYGAPGCQVIYGTVEVEAIGSPETWWKDLDGDGYSDGVSQAGCNPPSAGWHLAGDLTATSGDCDDTDAAQFPGQVWYKDMDGDNWSDGQILTQCEQPWGYYSATEVAGTTGDCDDTRNYCYPGAPEQCNNVDDDCDGQVDEGLGDLTYVGNVTFTNQTQVNNWSLCYTIIQGNLTIQNATIDSLTRLVNLRKVTGNVTIKLTSLDSLSWLMNLDTIGGTLNINTNSQLDRLHGLDSLMQVGTDLKVFNNQQLTECCAIYELINEVNGHYLGGSTSIYSNETGCDNTAEINTDCDTNYGGGGSNNLEIGNGGSGNWEIAEQVKVALLPNPADDEVTVRWQAASAEKASVGGSLRVFDARGRLAFSEKLEGADGEVKLDVSSWKSGIYLVQTMLGGEVSTQKLVVE